MLLSYTSGLKTIRSTTPSNPKQIKFDLTPEQQPYWGLPGVVLSIGTHARYNQQPGMEYLRDYEWWDDCGYCY